MDATFWTAVGSIVAVAGLAMAMVAHAIRYAYQRGAYDQRLTAVEKAQSDTASATAAIATLNVAVAALSATTSPC